MLHKKSNSKKKKKKRFSEIIDNQDQDFLGCQSWTNIKLGPSFCPWLITGFSQWPSCVDHYQVTASTATWVQRVTIPIAGRCCSVEALNLCNACFKPQIQPKSTASSCEAPQTASQPPHGSLIVAELPSITKNARQAKILNRPANISPSYQSSWCKQINT